MFERKVYFCTPPLSPLSPTPFPNLTLEVQTCLPAGVSERAKSRLNRTASKDSDDASGSPHLTPSKQRAKQESGSAHGTPTRQQAEQEASKQQGNGEAQNKSSFFATLDWTDDSGAAPEEGAPPVQRTEAQVRATFRAQVGRVIGGLVR